MKSPKTIRQEKYTSELISLLEREKSAHLLEKRWAVIEYLLYKEYPETMKKMGGVLRDFLKDTVYIDRKLRKCTEGDDQEAKDIAEQEFIIKEIM